MPLSTSIAPKESGLRYDRSSDLTHEDSLSQLARRVPPGATVLDLGAATGALARFLGERRGCTVDGVERDPDAARVARPVYRRLLELDLDTAVLAEHFPDAYDVIICADVIEHLRDPAALLRQLTRSLTADGRVLLSVPNVGYAGVVAGLLAGEFRYRDSGLLDRTHLRFFTRTTLRELLRESGLAVREITPLVAEPKETEFREAYLDTLPPAVLRALLLEPDALTYQFIVDAVPAARADAQDVSAVGTSPPTLWFGSQLYWAGDGEPFDEARSATARGVVGKDRQTIAFTVPPLSTVPARLRLDVADRPGFVRLHGLRLTDAAGAELWRWDGDPTVLEASERHDLALLDGPLGQCWFSRGTDAFVELPVPPAAFGGLRRGGTLTVDMGWPLSADFLLAGRILDDHEQRWAREREALVAHAERLEEKVAERLDEALRRADAACAEAGVTAERQTDMQAELAYLRVRNAALERRLDVVSARLWALESTSPLQQLTRSVLRGVRRRRVLLDPIAHHEVATIDPAKGLWQSLGGDPSFRLIPRRGRLPSGWVRLHFALETDASSTPPLLYLDLGEGFGEHTCLRLPWPHEGRVEATVALPTETQDVRLDPTDRAGTFRLEHLVLQEIGRVEALASLAAPALRKVLREPRRLPAALRAVAPVLRRGGLREVGRMLAQQTRANAERARYAQWVYRFDTLTDADRNGIAERTAALPWRPRFSVLMPTYDTPEPWLRRAIESVSAQLYADWELCIADDASPHPHVKRALAELAARDPRIRVVYRPANGHIAEATNSALDLATGDFVVLLDHDDELAPHALYCLAEELNAHPDADLLYSDEDKIDDHGERYDPFFKPDWNPDLLGSQNYVCHVSAFRTALVRRIGGFRKGFEGSQDYDLVLRVTAETTADRVRHVPQVLYHWRAIEGSTATHADAKRYAEDAAVRALREHYARTDPRIEVTVGRLPTTYRVRYPLPANPPLVSLLIPTRDAVAVLRRCIESVRAKTTYPRYEILVVDNQTEDPETLGYLAELVAGGVARVLRYDRPFNYSAINNYAAREARGDVLCLLNNDVEAISPDWLSELVSHAIRPEVGAVGAKLLYPNDTIQHAGVVTGLWGIAAHVHKLLPRDAPGYFSRAQLVHDVSAVTGACLVVRRALWEHFGGLDEERLAVAFNDVDFCLRLLEGGFRNVWTPWAELYHHESYTRGPEDTTEKRERFGREIAFMKRRWRERLMDDPSYNPNLSLESDCFDVAWPPRVTRPWRPTGEAARGRG